MNSRRRIQDKNGILFALVPVLCLFPLSLLRAQAPVPDDFNPGANWTVYSMAIQSDGKILVSGDFTTLGGQRRDHIGRLNGDGTVDSSFNPGTDGSVNCLAVQADGKILVGGQFTRLGGQSRTNIGRLNADGTPDSSFNPGANSLVQSLVVLSDGKILVNGYFTVLSGQARNNMGRLNADGTLDGTFNPSIDGAVVSVAIQADGRILLSGSFTFLGGQLRYYFGRLNADGTLDTTFNPGVDSPGVHSIIVLTDGKILVGGGFTTLGGQPRSRLGRLNVDGTLDSTFNPGATAHDHPARVYSLIVQADGKILVGGDFDTLGGQPRSFIGRLNADGTLDSTFNPGANGLVNSLAVQTDGKILVGGGFYTLGGQRRNYIGRLNNTDPATQALGYDVATITWLRGGSSPEVWGTTFEHSLDGLAWTDLGAGTRTPGGWALADVSLPPNGTLRVRGHVTGGRYNSSGWFVESYRGVPVLLSQPASQTNRAGVTASFHVIAGDTESLNYQWFKNGVLLLDQGNTAGASSATLVLSHVLKADEGSYHAVVSNSFGSVTSVVATLTVLDPFVIKHPLDTNGNVGGNATMSVSAIGTPPLSYQWYHDGATLAGAVSPTWPLGDLARADAGLYTVVIDNAYGSVTSAPALLTVNEAILDSTFNPSVSVAVFTLAIQADGKILVGGSFVGQPGNQIGRLNAGGTLDAAFNPEVDGEVSCLAIQPDGKILVGGTFTTLGGQSRANIGRLNVDGTVDSSFNPYAEGVSAFVYTVATQPDGKILVGGSFTTLGGQPRNNIGRLNPDGTLDTTFNPGVVGSFFPFNPASVFALAIQTDGKVLVGGDFTTLGGQPRNSIGRLHPDGTLDSTFNPGVSGGVFCLALQADGKILAGGSFTNLGGQPRNNIGRLNPDGNLDTAFIGEAGDSFSIIFTLATQVDGKILVGGGFTTLGGHRFNYIGRLRADGTVDSAFNPGADRVVSSLALQADGRILVGGGFTTLDGQSRTNIARLNNTDPATQTLGYDGATITWLRGGTSPEVWRTKLEHSSDGLTWTSLGPGERIPGGWQLAGVSLPPSGTLRARGHVSGSEVVATLSSPWPFRLRLIREGSAVVLSWPQGQGPYQVQQTTNLSQPGSWQDVGAPLQTNSVSLPIGAGTLFLRVREK